MSSNNNFGPYWTVNSQEAALGVMILVAAVIFPVAPIVSIGWYIGVEIIGNNFAKWGLGILFFILAYMVLLRLHHQKGLLYSGGFVFFQYFILDYIIMKTGGRDEMIMVKLVEKFINWGLSLS